MEKINFFLKKVWEAWDKKVILAFLMTLRSFADRRIYLKNQKYNPDQDWKIGIRNDFELWLQDLDKPVTMNDPKGLDKMDLFTLMGEFGTLRKEIRLQSREQAKNIKKLQDFNHFTHQTSGILALLEEKVGRLDAMEKQVRNRTEEKTVRFFFDIRNTLNRGLESARKSAKTLFFWRRKKLSALARGYEMALEKLDKALALTDTHPVSALGEKFDPETMRAVDRMAVSGMDKGMVAQEISCGFIRKGKVLETARVIVTE